MKHIKLLILSILVAIGFMYSYRSIFAALPERGPGFEIHNQSKLNMLFRLFVDGKQVADTKLIPGGEFQWELNLSESVVVEVYEPLSKSTLDKIRIDVKGKTKYIAWNPKRYNKPALYFFPQTKSNFGFSLDNNVEQKDIKYIKAKP